MYHCWWLVLYFPGAGILAGVAFPLRRYGLMITNEPVFFAATVAVVSTGVLAAPTLRYRIAIKISSGTEML
jgi:hypothetical protein